MCTNRIGDSRRRDVPLRSQLRSHVHAGPVRPRRLQTSERQVCAQRRSFRHSFQRGSLLCRETRKWRRGPVSGGGGTACERLAVVRAVAGVVPLPAPAAGAAVQSARLWRATPRASAEPRRRAVRRWTRLLVKVQRELEDQRESWRSEIDRLSRSTVQLDVADRLPSLEYFPNGAGGGGGGSSSSSDAGTNSCVDTSGRVPLFKAFVDVSEFDAGDVRVTVDKLADKIVVQARQPPLGAAGVSRSFTQRVQLPRFADDARLVARMNHRGILKVSTLAQAACA